MNQILFCCKVTLLPCLSHSIERTTSCNAFSQTTVLTRTAMPTRGLVSWTKWSPTGMADRTGARWTPGVWRKRDWKRADEKWPSKKEQIWWSDCCLENGNMSIREGNGQDRDGRNSDGWDEEEKKWRGTGLTQTNEGAAERWNRGGLSWHRAGRRKKRKIKWVNSR